MKVLSSVLVTVFIAAVSVSMVTPQAVSAVSCSGSGCNGKDPVNTGCVNSAQLIKQTRFIDVRTNTRIDTVYLQLYYSTTCGTNWVRINKNPFGGKAFKMISVAKTGGYVEKETDTGYGASYSMMVYAPGTTPVQYSGTLYGTAGKVRAYVPDIKTN